MLIDISRPIRSNMVVYPNNPGVRITRVQEAGENQNALSEITLGSHTGTHIDAPCHIHPGDTGIERFALDTFMGPVIVVEIAPDVQVIKKADIPDKDFTRIIFKTSNSSKNIDEFHDGFVALDDSAASELVARGVVLVGLDALSIKKRGVKDNVHQILLDAKIIIVEGLWLAEVVPGTYNLACLPLNIPHIDGVPARAVLSSYEN
ncbi:MAG: cyclase family protein [Candidatus Andersenbacteria bacterium]